MHFLELIAERKIAEAEAQGALKDLPGEGAPLDLDDDPLIPEDLRMAYRILKNAGLVAEEIAMLREIGQLEALVRDDGATQRDRAPSEALRRLELLRLRLDAASPGRATALLGDRYRQKILERIAGIEHDRK
jgi:DnaJ-like protein